MTSPSFASDISIQKLIDMAIAEDIGTGDITSRAIFTDNSTSRAGIIAKEKGILCGSFMAELIYSRIDRDVSIELQAEDGDSLENGQTVMTLTGKTSSLLGGERIVLNFMQRLSGIATRTAAIMDILSGTDITVLDTRKTLPGFRTLDKYAVRTGGGTNHRIGLFDMIMIKDNHIQASGSITQAIRMVRVKHGDTYKIEVEATTPEEAEEALEAGADIIMLDNMDRPSMKSSIERIGGKAKIEISGNMDEKKIKEILDLKIDYISIGALTHSVRAFDLSMRFK